MASTAIPDEPKKKDYTTEDAYYDALSDYYAQWSSAIWEDADPNTIWRNPALDDPWVSEVCDKLIELSAIDDETVHQQALLDAGITDEVLQNFNLRLREGRLQQPPPWETRTAH